MTTGKTIALTRRTFIGKIMSLLFNILCSLVVAFLRRNKHLLSFMAVVTIWSDFGAQENEVCHCFHCFSIYFPWSDGTGCHIFVVWMLSFRPAFSLSSFTFIKKLFSSSSLSTIRVVFSAYPTLLIFHLGLTGFQPKGLPRVFSSTTVQNINSLALNFIIVQLSLLYMTIGKNIALTDGPLLAK